MKQIQIIALETNPKKPQTCVSLSSYFGIDIILLERDGNLNTLTINDDWTPSREQKQELRDLLENGQEVSP